MKTQPGRNGGTLKADAGPGRPAGSVSLVSALKRELRENPEKLQAIVDATIQAAIEGDTSARKLVFDRIDGPMTEKVEVTNVSLTEPERVQRLASLYDRARARRDGLDTGELAN